MVIHISSINQIFSENILNVDIMCTYLKKFMADDSMKIQIHYKEVPPRPYP